MYCCYRDTKMEIQGLSDAQTIHSQHGAPHSTALSPFRSNTQPMFRTLSDENRDDGLLEAHQSQHDNNNNRPGTSPFRLLAENGSMARMSICKQQPKGKYHSQSDTTFANIGLCNVRENELLPQSNLRSVWKHVVDGGDAAMKMAFPFFEGEEEHLQHQLQSPGLRQQQLAGGASLQPAAPGSCNASRSHKTTEESHVVFNVVQEDGHRESAGTERQELLSTDHTMNGIPECSKITSCESTFVENINVLYVDGKACKKADCIGRVLNAQHADGEATAAKTKLPVYHTTEGTVSANRYDDTINDQLCTERIDDKLLGPLMLENTGIVNTRETMDTSDFISDPSSLQENTSADTASTSAPAHETFSGTIMINNQSIIVTIENGILTLAAPPEGYVHKDDDMVSLKEHLGMKDHEDIVLLNYDSGTKSIGKISTLAVASSSQHEPRAGLSVADAELALVDDCPLTEPSLESCPIIKQEVGTLCAITESDLVTPCSKNINTLDCDGNHDPQSVHLIRSKKETTVSFGCPQPGCASIFDTRQKLKVHFLNHAEDPRPYQCTVEDCGWAFTTSYKLKRHLQSHDKQRPHTCQFEGCGRRFTTVYNLKAHIKVHDQENAFVCEVCSERFRSATRLTNHQKVHFEPPRPHKCDFPGCEKTFITFSALFSHNRTHFREAGHFTCSYPGCDKMYDKACRLKIHLRSHTGERPFVCDWESCGWSFTSMSKLLRHKRKHDDDRRFTCPEEGCGKSFTRAEHLKGHSITHLGTKPFQCHAEGCNAKFSARSSLYIHSKKHKQDPSTLRNRCPVANCSKHFSSRSSLKSHMVKHHHLTADVLSQMETTPTLTPSSELVSSTPMTVAGPCVPGSDQLSNLDLSSLFSSVPGGPTAPGCVPSVGGGSASAFTAADFSLVSSGILTIDPSSVAAALGPNHHAGTTTKTVDPLILAAAADMASHHHHGLEGTVGHVLPPQGTLNLDDVQSVTPEALGTLAALSMQSAAAAVSGEHGLSHSLAAFSVEPPTTSLAAAPVANLLAPSPSKVAEVGGQGGAGPLLGCVEVLGPQEGGGKGLGQFVFPSSSSSSSFSPQKDPELSAAMSPSSFLESGGSARTDYRAIQLAKKKKQKGPAACSTNSVLCQRKSKVGKAGSASVSVAPSSGRYGDVAATASGGLTLRDPVTGAQYVQIQLLQDDPASDGDLAFQLSSQPSSSHSQLTVDLPVNILQESSVMPEDDNGSDTSQFTGSTINLQDLE